MTTNMNRRGFIGSTVGAAVAMASGPVTTGQASQSGVTGPSKGPMKISILSYSFRNLLADGRMSVFGYLETCKYRYKLNAADIWSTGPRGFLPTLEDSFLRKVKDALDEREMVLADLCVDSAQVWDDNPARRQTYYENAMAHLKAASVLGARFVRIDAGAGKDRSAREFTNEQFDHVVKRYKEYAQFAYDHGFKTGAESHWGPEDYWPTMKKLIKAVDHPGFGISVHIGGWTGTQEEKDLADRESAPYTCHTHIAWNIVEGPLVEKLSNLWNAGYPGSYSVEHHAGRDEYTEVAIQLAKVRAVLESFRTGGTGGSLAPRRRG
ncbi:MAG: sugar phosphate isomerase/epimerase [Phycisphaerae bacterium]|nr:sugar phosphate isomerase/epimerase [Phycisphaerae bacterium]